ncbi:accessory Sec system translocase SecA2 [Pseudonocardia sp. GCM10023141]|uniref:accessory Sec system translocase SecA2 n=1 Tax=Pseudonocardia sp. GCM10023141 TaxID=3252653 RepID=UPI0036171531
MLRVLQRPATANVQRYRKVATAAGALEAQFEACSDTELTAAAQALRTAKAPWAQLCAIGREAARRTLGERPFDVQLIGTVGLLTGHVVEMATGEGKTLSGALAAAGFVLQGRRVHVLSPNDYLARRDATWMRELFALMGVTVGWIDQHSTPEQRREAYAADVLYGSVSEIGFDVLRHRLRTDTAGAELPEPDVAIVDEVDSVLIDEARVPLVLAGAAAEAPHDATITALVAGLEEDTHYETDDDRRNVFLTEAGLDRLEKELGDVNLYGEDHRHRLTEINAALHAQALLHRDVDYIVRGGKVELINVSRGRVGRLQRWPDGLQAAVEAKEGVAASDSGEVLDSMLVQALVKRYRTVCGMSGTAVAVAEQLQEFYKLPVGRVPTNVDCIRVDEPDRLYRTVAAKEAAVVTYVAAVHATGRPVLLGTQDVAESERLAAQLAAAGVEAVVLNAKNDVEEAAIIAHAGERDRVTISTQMAGRGTDIRLGEGVAALGGLCVVGMGRYHTRRLDDQLRGRAGRQGDPGGSLFFTSFDDDLVVQQMPDAPVPQQVDEDGAVHDARAQHTVENAQRAAEGAHLDGHRGTWRYNQLGEGQRADLLAHRDHVLRGDEAARHLEERSPQRYARLRTELGADVVAEAARQIVLYHLDRGWSDHLGFLTDVREGIHLRAIARETPVDEYHRIAIAEFEEFLQRAYERATTTFDSAAITADGVDLEGLGLQRPASTWTYMVNDNPFGNSEDRFLHSMGTMMRRSGLRPGSAAPEPG